MAKFGLEPTSSDSVIDANKGSQGSPESIERTRDLKSRNCCGPASHNETPERNQALLIIFQLFRVVRDHYAGFSACLFKGLRNTEKAINGMVENGQKPGGMLLFLLGRRKSLI